MTLSGLTCSARVALCHPSILWSTMFDHFSCSRVNDTTFVVHEKDVYEEHPFIYVKVYDDIPVIVLSDTGSGSSTDEHSLPENLRNFLETLPIAVNNGQLFNPRDAGGKVSKKYMIIFTHCHYDHILGIEQFQDPITDTVAPREGKGFVENNLAEHSLCETLDIPTPQYTITNWAKDKETLSFDGKSLDLQIIHTPGHTPDELAWYDKKERHLFVGDTLYERVAEDKSYEQAILFPKEGNIIDYLDSLNKLIVFVEAKNGDDDAHKGRLKIGCGHVTSSVDAMEILVAVQTLFANILEDKVPIAQREEKRGEEYVTWRDDGEPRFSVTAPRRIVFDAKQALQGKVE